MNPPCLKVGWARHGCTEFATPFLVIYKPFRCTFYYTLCSIYKEGFFLQEIKSSSKFFHLETPFIVYYWMVPVLKYLIPLKETETLHTLSHLEKVWKVKGALCYKIKTFLMCNHKLCQNVKTSWDWTRGKKFRPKLNPPGKPNVMINVCNLLENPFNGIFYTVNIYM